MKTDATQSGLIKLAEGKAKISYGTFETIGFFSVIKFKENWKILGAYKYNHNSTTTVTPDDTNVFNESVVNGDPALASWSMRTLNFALEYEKEYSNKTISAGITIDVPLNGKYIFDTKMYGTGASISYEW